MDDRPIVLADNVNAKFLISARSWTNLTTMSSLLTSNGSLSTPSGERRSLLMKVPLDDLRSLMYIYRQSSKCRYRLSGPVPRSQHAYVIVPSNRSMRCAPPEPFWHWSVCLFLPVRQLFNK